MHSHLFPHGFVAAGVLTLVSSASAETHAVSERAQRHFEQGQIPMYAFNHRKAIRAFHEAVKPGLTAAGTNATFKLAKQ